MDVPYYALIALIRQFKGATRNVSPPRHGCGWASHNAVENRSPLSRSGRPRILPLCRLTEVRGPHRNVVEKGDVADFDADQCGVAAAAAAAAAASGYEVEVL